MRKSWTVWMALAIVAMSVPAFAGGDNENTINEGCLKIEDEQIGVEGLAVSVDGVTLTFSNWIEKADSPGEYIGFDYTTTGGTFAEFDVKQGQEYVYVTLDGTSGSWHNNTGISGSDVKGTSHIRFCGADDTVVTPTTIVSPPPPPPPG